MHSQAENKVNQHSMGQGFHGRQCLTCLPGLGVVGWCDGATIWITVGQGPIALAVGVGGGCLDIFYSHLHFLSSFSLSLGAGLIQTEILSQRVVKPKTTNQPKKSTRVSQ